MSLPSTRQLNLKLAFPVGGEVYLRCRGEALLGLVVALMVRQGLVTYVVAWGDAKKSTHYDFELSEEPPAL